MSTVLDALGRFEEYVMNSDGPDGYFHGRFQTGWMKSERRNRLMSVLGCLNDLETTNIQMWTSFETAVTFAEDGKALWLSYTGNAFHIWTNFGGEETTFALSNNIILEDGGMVDNRNTVVQVVRDYFRTELVEAA